MSTEKNNSPASNISESILDRLKREGPRSLDQLAEDFDLSRTAMRAQLLRLEGEGSIERVPALANGRGRPPLVFRLTMRGGSLFPTSDAEILTALLHFIDAKGKSELIHQFFAQFWSQREREFEQLHSEVDGGADSLDMRVAALHRLLERSLFMPNIAVEKANDGRARLKVFECNCPLPAAIRATRVPCKLESQFLETALGAELESMSIASNAAQPCCFVLTQRRSDRSSIAEGSD